MGNQSLLKQRIEVKSVELSGIEIIRFNLERRKVLNKGDEVYVCR